MADPVEQNVPPTPVVAPAPSPESSPIPQSVAPVQADQVVAASPVPTAETPPSEAVGTEAPPTAEPTLLEKFEAEKEAAKAAEAKPATEEVKPAEVKPAEEAPKPVEEVKSAETVVEPVPLTPIDYFAAETGLKIPETLKMDDAQRGAFATALDAFRTDPSAASAQQILDMGTKAMADYAEQLRRDQWSTFNSTRIGWQTEVKADPELGGAGYNTTMENISIARDVLASRHKPGTEKYQAEMKEFNDFLKVTGAGDHPAFIRLLNNARRYVGEQVKQPANPAPPPAPKAPRGKSNLYSNTEFPK